MCTYTLDNTNPTVQGLKTGDVLTEVFGYRLSDLDGDTDSGEISIGIRGVDDPPPQISFNTANQSGSFLYIASENVGFASGQLTLTATAGLKANGTALQITPQGGGPTQITLAALQAANASNTLDIAGAFGTFKINSYAVVGSNTTLGFEYSVPNVPGSFGHSTSDPAQDFFDFLITDNENDMASTTVEFRLTDTAPTAAADVSAINENEFLVVGNVISGGAPSSGLGFDAADTSGADTALSVSQVSFMASPFTVGTPFSSVYGTLDLNADGTYTYTLDNANTSVHDLNNGQILTEIFNYTIIDTDGDTSTTTLTVNINGVTD